LFVFTSNRIYLLTDFSSSVTIIVKLDFEGQNADFESFSVY